MIFRSTKNVMVGDVNIFVGDVLRMIKGCLHIGELMNVTLQKTDSVMSPATLPDNPQR